MHGKIVVSSIDADARAHASMSNAHQVSSGDGSAWCYTEHAITWHVELSQREKDRQRQIDR